VIYSDSSEEEEEEEDEEMEEEESADATPAPADGLQTPSGLDTPSGLTSVVSTVPGGIETPDFLELRKRDSGATVEAASGAPKQLYHVVPERQTAVRGLMGSERGYDLGAVGASAAAGVPVLGDERGNKVS
jgi:splicing factor 3B subunit 2